MNFNGCILNSITNLETLSLSHTHIHTAADAADRDVDEDLDEEEECQWLPFEFHYKPGNEARAPGWVAPHQPRLDWQVCTGKETYSYEKRPIQTKRDLQKASQ